MKILIATRNPGKLREYTALLSDLSIEGMPVEWVLLTDVGVSTEVEETGGDLGENASLKAKAYAQMSGLLTLADDSGLEVDALGGEPGVHSARYGEPGLDDEGRYRLLLKKLADVPPEQRQARFRCIVALCSPDGGLSTAEGICEGSISFEPRGQHGFGYDPVFWVAGTPTTMAELDPAVKNRISHRARALEAIKPKLIELIKGTSRDS